MVERDTPSVRPASSTVTISTAMGRSYRLCATAVDPIVAIRRE